MNLGDDSHSKIDKDWRLIAEKDQERKHEKQKSEKNSESELSRKKSSLQELMVREQAVQEQGWRGAQRSYVNQEQQPQQTQDCTSKKRQEQENGWRTYRLSEENKALRDQEQKEKMAQKSAKRARKAEQAIASWEKQKRHRVKSKSPQKSNSYNYRSHQNQSKSASSESNDVYSESAYKKSTRPSFNDSNPREKLSHDPDFNDHNLNEHGTQHKQIETQHTFPSQKHPKGKVKKVKQRPPISETWLKSAGIRYLGRFSASEQHFRYTMLQKIRNAESRESDDPTVHLQWIESAVKLAREYGFLDDQKYANALASSLKRRGLAKSAARQKLRQKRVGASHIDEALNQSYMQTDEMQIDPNLYAAARAAQKKRLGPWGPENIDYPTLQKQLAKLARRGFSYGIAKQVLQSSLEEAEQWLLDGDL